jgi:acyl-CoA reductase-like NAD-dependent aldehyde dehydrogenase
MIAADREYRLSIGGERVPGSRGTYEVVNPATEEVVGLAPEASGDDARNAAAAAAAAFPSWSLTPPAERAALLDRAADLLQARAPELVPLVQAETGSTMAMAQAAQVSGTIARLRRYARGALEALDSAFVPVPNAGGGPDGLSGGIICGHPVWRIQAERDRTRRRLLRAPGLHRAAERRLARLSTLTYQPIV